MKRIALLAAFAALPACSLLDKLPITTPAPSPPPAAAPAAAPAPGRTSADELVNYLGRLKGMNETAVAAEAARQRQAAGQRDASDVARVKAAMAMTLAGQAEESEVLSIVDPLARAGGSRDPDVRAMASFLQAIAHERRRLKESATAVGARLREAQRARENEKQRADALQERAAQLQQKLDALTDLEKSLSDRQNPTR